MTIDFTRNTNSAGKPGVQFECQEVLSVQEVPDSLQALAAFSGSASQAVMLAALVGENGVCFFSTPSTLNIKFGSRAVLPVGMALSFVPGSIRGSEAFSRPVDDIAFVTAPETPISPVISLNYPQLLGACDELVLDASQTSGAAGRELAFSWEVKSYTLPSQSAFSGVQELQSILASASASNNFTVAVPAGTLAPGTSVTLDVSATNFLSQSSALSAQGIQATIVSSPGNLPSLSIAGGAFKTVTRSEELVLEVAGSMRGCDPAAVVQLDYSIEAVSGPSDVSTFIQRQRSNKIALPPGVMLVGQGPYVFSASASVVGDAAAVKTANITVNVQRQNVEPIIVGGDRTIGLQAGALELSAALSKDPNNDDLGQGLKQSVVQTFAWTCTVADSGDSCTSALLGSADSATVSIPVSLLTPFARKDLVFSVVFTSDGISASTKTTVQVAEGALPDLSVPPPPNAEATLSDAGIVFKVDPLKSLRLLSQSSDAGLSYSWQEADGKVSGAAFSTPTSQAAVALRPRSLVPGVTYTFRVSAHHPSNPALVASAVLRVLANAAPFGGTVQASPASGTAVSDRTTVTAPSWEDDAGDGPLVYQFFIDVAGADPTPDQLAGAAFGTPVSSVSETNQASFTFPASTSASNLVTVLVRVMDRLGSSSAAFTKLTSRPALSTGSSAAAVVSFVNSASSVAAQAVAAGEAPQALAVLSSLGGLLNANSAQAGSDAGSDAQASRSSRQAARQALLGSASSVLSGGQLDDSAQGALVDSMNALTAAPQEVSDVMVQTSVSMLRTLTGTSASRARALQSTTAGLNQGLSGKAKVLVNLLNAQDELAAREGGSTARALRAQASMPARVARALSAACGRDGSSTKLARDVQDVMASLHSQALAGSLAGEEPVMVAAGDFASCDAGHTLAMLSANVACSGATGEIDLIGASPQGVDIVQQLGCGSAGHLSGVTAASVLPRVQSRAFTQACAGDALGIQVLYMKKPGFCALVPTLPVVLGGVNSSVSDTTPSFVTPAVEVALSAGPSHALLSSSLAHNLTIPISHDAGLGSRQYMDVDFLSNRDAVDTFNVTCPTHSNSSSTNVSVCSGRQEVPCPPSHAGGRWTGQCEVSAFTAQCLEAVPATGLWTSDTCSVASISSSTVTCTCSRQGQFAASFKTVDTPATAVFTPGRGDEGTSEDGDTGAEEEKGASLGSGAALLGLVFLCIVALFIWRRHRARSNIQRLEQANNSDADGLHSIVATGPAEVRNGESFAGANPMGPRPRTTV